VFWVVDNGSSHRGQRAVDRIRRRWPRAHLVQLPVHASWLNQVEIYFSVVQRKVLTPNDFADLAEVEWRLAAFERRYEQTARPFEWKFTRSDLTKLLERLADKADYRTARHDPARIRDRNSGPEHLVDRPCFGGSAAGSRREHGSRRCLLS
jgi:hypothetical protein